jgi:hypothetical protein
MSFANQGTYRKARDEILSAPGGIRQQHLSRIRNLLNAIHHSLAPNRIGSHSFTNTGH